MSDTHEGAVVVERSPFPDVLHPVVRAALAQQPDTQTLRELLTLQREWEAAEAKRAYTRALVALKRDLPTVIARDQTVDYTTKDGRHVHYTHPSLAALVEAATEALTNHGFSLTWDPSTPDKTTVTVAAVLTHSAGHGDRCSLSAPPDISGNKNPAQAVASTVALLARYTAALLLGITSRDMVEPTGQGKNGAPTQSTDQVNSQRNLKAAGKLAHYGRTRMQAEEFLRKKVAEWTTTDIEKLSTWVKGDDATAPSPQPGPPAILLDKLIDTMTARKDFALLDADADLIVQLPQDQQVEASAEYHRLRSKLVAQ